MSAQEKLTKKISKKRRQTPGDSKRTNTAGLARHITGEVTDNSRRQFVNRDFAGQNELDASEAEFYQEAAARERMKQLRLRVNKEILAVKEKFSCADEYELLERLKESNAHPMAISVQQKRIEKQEKGEPLPDITLSQSRPYVDLSGEAGPSTAPCPGGGGQIEDQFSDLAYDRPYERRTGPLPTGYYGQEAASERIRQTRDTIVHEMSGIRERYPNATECEILRRLIETGAHPQTIANQQLKVKTLLRGRRDDQEGYCRISTPAAMAPPSSAPATPAIPRTKAGKVHEFMVRDEEEEPTPLAGRATSEETPQRGGGLGMPRRRIFPLSQAGSVTPRPTDEVTRRTLDRMSGDFTPPVCGQPTEARGARPPMRPSAQARADPLPPIHEEPEWYPEHRRRFEDIQSKMKSWGMKKGHQTQGTSRQPSPCSARPAQDLSSSTYGLPAAESTRIGNLSMNQTSARQDSHLGYSEFDAGHPPASSPQSRDAERAAALLDAVTPCHVRRLVDEERREVRAMHEITQHITEPAKQVQFKDIKGLVPHVITEETETAPEVAAAMLYSEEKGLSLQATPARVYKRLFNNRDAGKSVIRVNAPSSHTKHGVLVPMSTEGVGVTFSAYATPGSDSLPFETPSELPPLATRENQDVGDERDNLGYSISSIGQESQKSSSDDKFKITLEPDFSDEKDMMQIRGSQSPSWFPGYYVMMGHDKKVNVINKPWEVLERSWRQFVPEKMTSVSGKIIVGT